LEVKAPYRDGGKQDIKKHIQIIGKALRIECLMKIGNPKKEEPLKISWM
tara:strand:+ start:167 stop:313 length:147 start_codon:yes stop_codon:yes gene_type:complete